MKRNRKKILRKAKYYIAWTVLIFVECLVSAIPIVLLGFVIIPIAKSTRACDCLGGEALLLCFAYWRVFVHIHHFVADKIFDTKEGK